MQELINLAVLVTFASIFGTLVVGVTRKKGWESIVGDSINKVFTIAFFTIVLILTGTYPQ